MSATTVSADAVATDAPPLRTAHRVRSMAGLLLVLGLLGALLYAGYWSLQGGRWFVVQTPSMGTAAPVGTLVWVEPVRYTDIHVGDVITFRPHHSPVEYTHRVHSIDPAGALHTKGDANGSPDPWTLTAPNVVGRVTARWWGVGWLVRAAPILFGGGLLLVGLTTRLVPRRNRQPILVMGVATLVSVSVWLYRPLTGAAQISMLPTGGGLSATYVSTGILPLRLQATGGSHVDLRSGQTGSVVTGHASDGRLSVTLHPLTHWWWWLVLGAVCFAPAALSSLQAKRRERYGRSTAS